jgi:hypothetical protein
MQKAVWLSFDLGVNGDYESMYSWLANQDAKECGDSLAFFNYETHGDLVSELTADLQDAILIQRKKTRIYVMYRSDDGKVKGTFLFGARKQAPWTGYGVSQEASTDES